MSFLLQRGKSFINLTTSLHGKLFMCCSSVLKYDVRVVPFRFPCLLFHMSYWYVYVDLHWFLLAGYLYFKTKLKGQSVGQAP